jgi:protoporphyrinogen/coproporphyrinogen III oxidase
VTTPQRVAVIGGGIAGLSAAWSLLRPELARQRNARSLTPHVTIFESSANLGGKIRTSEFAGSTVEEGPDAFLARVPWGTRLCHELGLDDQLVSPGTQQASVWTETGLRPFPRDTVLGVPSRLLPLLRSNVLSRKGAARAFLDHVMPPGRGRTADDASIAEVIGTRLGTEVLDSLVEPLLGGINAGNVETLSLASAAPQLAELSSAGPSLIRSARAQLKRRNIEQSPRPVFYSTRGGLSTLVTTLEKALRDKGAGIHTGSTVQHLEIRDGRWILHTGTDEVEADAVVIATPSFVTANLIAALAPDAAMALHEIRYSSVAIVRLAYNDADIPVALDSTGFVVPSRHGHLLTACSWVSSKWPETKASGTTTLRASVGRMDDDRFTHFSDEELVDAVHVELTEVMGVRRRPESAGVIRWMSALPQYEIGHASRVQTAVSALRSLPPVALAGAAYDGLGIPACIRSGSEAGEAVLERLAHSVESSSR